MTRKFRRVPSLCCGLLCIFSVTSSAADSSTDGNASPSVTQPATAANQISSEQITELKLLLANQQKQIEELRRSLDEQKKMLENATGNGAAKSSAPSNASLISHPKASLGDVASLTPIVPSGGADASPGWSAFHQSPEGLARPGG